MNEEVRILFRDLADLTPAERQQHYALRQVPADLRDEVESLLRFDTGPSDSMTDIVGSAVDQFLMATAPVTEDGRCGPYRLVRLLGNGGMGAVYLAERADGELQHRVAIKFLRTGEDLPSFRDRFLRERQILASLNHPGIARLLDAGHAAGQPYLVMEYVDGIRIDQYASRLDVRGVLNLFLGVAEAVSYAHRNLIIHRDLKPSNILIDAHGKPKLLDFGIAKILDDPELTLTLERMMTPEYASPEQLRGDVQATTTDVYSLGAVLHKLLTGQSPQARDQSTPRLPRDLAAIVARAMREEPEERYASVDLLIADVQAWLEHRPVRAVRGNAWYLARKFIRRRWIPVAACALAVAGLAGGLIVAKHERDIAQRRFQQVRQLSRQFFDLDADIRTLPGSTTARNRIVSASLQYLERLGAEARSSRWGPAAEQDVDLALDIAGAYLQVARVQGVPGASNLGQFAQARESLARADSFVEATLAVRDFPRRRDALFTSAEIAHDSMILADSENRTEEAISFARKTAGRLDDLMRAGAVTPAQTSIAGKLYTNLALAHQRMHRLDESAAFARRAVDLARRSPNDRRLLGLSMSVLANTYRFGGNLDGALQLSREARAMAEQMADREDVARTLMLSAALWREAVILGEANNINLGRPREAVPLLRQSLDLAESLAKRDPADYTSRSYVSMAGRELGDILRESDPAEALAVYDHTRRRLEETRNPRARRDLVWVLTGSAYALRRLGRPAESHQRIQEAFAILRELKAYPAAAVELGDDADAALRALADHQADTRQTASAIATYEELHQKVQASNPQPANDLRHANGLSRIYSDLAVLYRRAGRSADAAELDQRRLVLWQEWNRRLPDNPFIRRQLAAARLN